MSFDEAFARLPDLTTSRLKVRQLQLNDAEAIFEIKSNPDVTSRYGAEPNTSIEQTRKWVEERVSDYKNRTVLYWVFTLNSNNRPIGSICFWHLDIEARCAEVGYELNSIYWKRGYMFEAMDAVLDYGFGLGFNRIEAAPFEINEPSKKLLLKLGFKHEGTLRDRWLFHGQYWNQLYFGLLKEEWVRRKQNFEPHS